MSDEPGEYDESKLMDLLIAYFKKDSWSAMRIKTVLLPALEEQKSLTRNELKEEFVKMGKAADESQAGYFIALISTQLGLAYRDYLRQIIYYDYPENEWTKDNFCIREGYAGVVERLFNELERLGLMNYGKAIDS